MNDNTAPELPTRGRLERHLDQLIWRLARIEGDLGDLRKALNAFRSDLAIYRQETPQDTPPDHVA